MITKTATMVNATTGSPLPGDVTVTGGPDKGEDIIN